jgi:ribosomal protein S14
MCRYCFRPAVVTVIRRNGYLRQLFGLPREKIATCYGCITRVAR